MRQISPARAFSHAQAPEPPVNPQTRLMEAARDFYARLALPPSPSELIDQLAHETDPAERRAIATLIGRSAP